MLDAYSVVYTGNGTRAAFDIPFPYLEREHIRLMVDGQPVPFTWLSSSRIRASQAPLAGSTVLILRVTPKDPLYILPANRPIPALWFNRLVTQAIYIATENRPAEFEDLSQAQGYAERAERAAEEASAALSSLTDVQDTVNRVANLQNVLTEKWLITADWQLRLDDGESPPNFYSEAEENRRRGFLRAQLSKIERGVDFGFFNGDLIDRPHLKVSGDTSRYGFKEFLEDLAYTGISKDRWFCLPGNHESDHIVGDIQTRATTEEYQRWIGPTNYYMLKGNHAHVFVGDEAGFGSQEISTMTLDWLETTLDSLRGNNIWLHFHAPILGAHPNVASDTSDFGIIHGAARLQPILSKYRSHIVCATYGHVGVTPPLSVHTATVAGIRWINITTFLQAAAGELSPDLSLYHFNYVELTRGTRSARLRRMKLSDRLEDVSLRINLTLPYASDLGGAEPSYDGRRSAQISRPSFRGPVRSTMDVSWAENREATSGGAAWLPRSADYYEAFQAYITESGNDPFPVGMLGGFGVYLNNQLTERTTEDSIISVGSPTRRKAWLGARQPSNSSLRGQVVLAAARNDGTLEEVARFSTSDEAGNEEGMFISRVHIPASGFLGLGGGAFGGSLLTSGEQGVLLYASGLSRWRRNAVMLQLFRDDVEGGAIMSFHNSMGAQVGGVTTSATSTSFNQTSDKRVKEDFRDFDGLETVNRIEFVDYAWKVNGLRSRGVLAQDLYEVAPYAVTPGETGEDLWSVDLSKLVPDFGRAIQQLCARVVALEESVAALSAPEA